MNPMTDILIVRVSFFLLFFQPFSCHTYRPNIPFHVFLNIYCNKALSLKKV